VGLRIVKETKGPANANARAQFSTFVLGGRMYGVDVIRVQEVVRSMPMTMIPLAASYVKGLINLRGQVATAIGLRELFGFKEGSITSSMNMVCKFDGNLVSFLVDEIGDVVEVARTEFETTPQTVPEDIKRFMQGVYKMPGNILSIIDIDKLMAHLNK
jgi:purine-binding chemotaxis protein CheW